MTTLPKRGLTALPLSAEAVFRAMKSYLVGHDPVRLEEMRFRIANPTASLYNNRTQVLAALEFACLDLLGQQWGVPGLRLESQTNAGQCDSEEHRSQQ